MTLRRWHAASAVLLAAFAAIHLANHLAGLAGVQAHLHYMHVLRRVYRAPLIEPLLLGAAAFQAASGLTMVVRGWRERRGTLAWVQAISGAYLGFFLVFHIGAVIVGRAVMHLDTNFYFAAAGLHVMPYSLFFAPYYFLAVFALFTHIGCALHWRLADTHTRTHRLAWIVPAAGGAMLALTIVLMLCGSLYPVVIPPAYLATYDHPPRVAARALAPGRVASEGSHTHRLRLSRGESP